MKILIVGLGMIGSSYAQGLTEKGHMVYGVDKDEETIIKAKALGLIVDGSKEATDFIKQVELIIVGLYPKATLEFIKNNSNYFIKGQVITDVCGVKIYVEEINKYLNGVEFIASHPMAGSEKSGFEARKLSIFKGANFLITPFNNSEKAIDIIKRMAADLGFGKTTIMEPKYHDKVIAFTSQLTHAIAVALVNSDVDENTPDHTGDSYRDLTRIAKINEELWSELFLENKGNLLKCINDFEIELDKIKRALIENNQDELKEMMKSSCEKRKRF